MVTPEVMQAVDAFINTLDSQEDLLHIESWARTKRFSQEVPVGQSESDEQIAARLTERFSIIGLLTKGCMLADVRSLIISGPAGVGKSWTVDQTLRAIDPTEQMYLISRGYAKATGLWRNLWDCRHKGQVLVLDDNDAVFNDETALNILKTACDTTRIRIMRWGSEYDFGVDEGGEQILTKFEFNGAVIFLTNYNLDERVEKKTKLSHHLEALISRSHYIDTSFRSRRDCLIRIKQVMNDGMLGNIPVEHKLDILKFIEDNQDRLREISLRIALKLNTIRNMGDKWESIARITCLK
jgi:hypothetical protein